MAVARDRTKRRVPPIREVDRWARSQGLEAAVARLDDGQRAVLTAALAMVAAIGAVAPLRRIAGWLLRRPGVGLPQRLVAAVVGVSDRALRTTQQLAPAALVAGVGRHTGGVAPPLRPAHAGPIAQFLARQPDATLTAIRVFVHDALGVAVSRPTLRQFLDRYGLGCLRGDAVTPTAPFLRARRTAVRSS